MAEPGLPPAPDLGKPEAPDFRTNGTPELELPLFPLKRRGY